MDVEQPVGYYYKDRFFSVKVRFLKERKWHLAIAIGTNDPLMHYNDHNNDAKSLTATSEIAVFAAGLQNGKYFSGSIMLQVQL